MTSRSARFVANDRAHAHALLIHKALPLKVKGEIRKRLEALPDERMVITVEDHTFSIESAPAVVAPQPEVLNTPQPDRPAKPRRSQK